METTPLWCDLVAVGCVARAHGRRGEVAVNLLTDFPDRLEKLHRVYAEIEGGAVVSLPLEWVRRQSGRPIVKFVGVTGIEEAERLRGCELRIEERELEPLPRGSYYQFRVRGCEVWDRCLGFIGSVGDVMETGGTDILVVVGPQGSERLIPFCSDICRSIDTERRRIEIVAPEGLLTLNES